METDIFWFSTTGNSLAAAKGIAQRLGGKSSLRPIVSAVSGSGAPSSGAARIGFVFPLFFLGCPAAVGELVDALEAPFDADIFCVATRGTPGMGGAMRDIGRRLKRRGFRLRFGAYIDMPSNFGTLFGRAGPEEAARRLEACPGRLDSIAKGILSGRGSLPLEPTALLLPIRQKAYRERRASAHLKWFADESCTGCGTCVRACPFGRIRMEGERPAWEAGCQECEACFHWCPAKAIQYRGAGTEAKWRYRHPGTALGEIEGQK
jgi:ferredoxin